MGIIWCEKQRSVPLNMPIIDGKEKQGFMLLLWRKVPSLTSMSRETIKIVNFGGS